MVVILIDHTVLGVGPDLMEELEDGYVKLYRVNAIAGTLIEKLTAMDIKQAIQCSTDILIPRSSILMILP